MKVIMNRAVMEGSTEGCDSRSWEGCTGKSSDGSEGRSSEGSGEGSE